MNINVFSDVAQRIYDKDVERMIHERSERELLRARAHAHSLADRFLPLKEGGDTLDDYFSSFTTAFNAIMAEADAKIGRNVCMAEGKHEIDQAEVKKERIDQQSADERTALINAKTTRDRLPMHKIDRRAVIITLAAVAVITGGEMLYNAYAFSLFSANLLFALVISVGFWVGLYAATHGIPLLIGKVRKFKAKVAVGVGFLFFFSFLFYWLGTLRTAFAHENGTAATTSISPFGLMLLNIFMFGACIFLVHYFLPSNQMRDEIKERARWDRRVKECEKAIAELEERKMEVEHEKKERLNIILKRMGYAEQIEKLIRELYGKALAEFKDESILRLRYVAPCLRETPTPLKGFAADLGASLDHGGQGQ